MVSLKAVDRLVVRIVPEVVNQDAAGRERLIAVAAKGPAAAVAHGHRPAGAVVVKPGIAFKHGGQGALAVKLRRQGVVIHALAAPGHFAEDQPLVEPVMDVVALPPAAARPGQLQRGGGAITVFPLQVPQQGRRPLAVVVASVGGHADAPVLVAVPAVVKDVRLGLHIGVHRLVQIGMEFAPVGLRPGVVTQVIGEAAESEIVGEGHVARPDGAVHVFHRQLLHGLGQDLVALDGCHQRRRHDPGIVVGFRITGDASHPLIFRRPLSGQGAQFLPRTQQIGMLPRHRVSPVRRRRPDGARKETQSQAQGQAEAKPSQHGRHQAGGGSRRPTGLLLTRSGVGTHGAQQA